MVGYIRDDVYPPSSLTSLPKLQHSTTFTIEDHYFSDIYTLNTITATFSHTKTGKWLKTVSEAFPELVLIQRT
jgi:hypothetical protein